MKKSKIAIIAVVLSMTFATAANAGIFDVVGGVLGVMGAVSTVQQNYHAKRAEQAGSSYLNKMATKIQKTGDPDAEFNDVVKQYQDGKYDVKLTEADNGNVKTMTAEKSDMVVRAIWTLDKNAQTITVKHESVADGSLVGEAMTKKYELPEGVAHAQPSVQPQNAKPIQAASANININPELQSKFNQMPLCIKDEYRTTPCKIFILGGKTGCPTFDNSKLVDRARCAVYAYYISRNETGWKSNIDSIIREELKKKNDPFSAPKLKAATNDLIAYYKAGNVPNIAMMDIKDYTSGDVNYIIQINDGKDIYTDTYNIQQQLYVVRIGSMLLLTGGEDYTFPIPQSAVENVYNTVKKILDNNQQTLRKIDSAHKSCPKQKITVVRICKGLDTLCGSAKTLNAYRNAYFQILAMDGYVSVVNYKKVYDFKNSHWKVLLSEARSNCNMR